MRFLRHLPFERGRTKWVAGNIGALVEEEEHGEKVTVFDTSWAVEALKQLEQLDADRPNTLDK